MALPIIGAQMAMYNQMGAPMPDFVPDVHGETGKVASVKAVTRKMVQFDPKRRCTMTQVVKDIVALGGMTSTCNTSWITHAIFVYNHERTLVLAWLYRLIRKSSVLSLTFLGQILFANFVTV